ncbi:MAG: hypothetical protein ACRESZ_22520 [Methylococcales bacterium]
MTALRGYTLNLYFDREHWLAHFVEMPEISAFSAPPEKVLRELQTAWELVKADYIAQGLAVPASPRRKRIVRVIRSRFDDQKSPSLPNTTMRLNHA